MRLSRTIAYAVHATLELAHSGQDQPVPCNQIAKVGNLPERFLLRILRRLVTSGVLRSTRGVDGGYSLSKPPNEISLLEIVDSFDHSLQPDLPALENLSQEAREHLMKALQQAAVAARQELQRLTIADLMRPENDQGETLSTY